MSRKPVRRHRAKPSSRAKKPPLPRDPRCVTVQSIGAKGDGLGTDETGQPYFVPYSAAGDVVEVRVTDKRGDHYVGDILNVITPSPDRQDAPCPYYGKCGGCSLQHVSDVPYKNWKSERVEETLQRAGIDVALDAPILIPAGHRRRANFAAMKKGKKIVFGFNGRASHRIEEIDDCLLLTQQLNSLIKPLRALLNDVMKQEGRGDIIINFPDGACDLVLALPGRVDLKIHETLISFADKNDIARISWKNTQDDSIEVIAQRRSVTTRFGETDIALPPSPFLQPSKSGEEALVEIALSALTTEKKVLDLYAGCGSFTFALAEKTIVHAVETNAEAIKSLELAAGRAGIGGRISGEVRDLSRQPLMGKELAKYDAVLFDPPRAGAREQAEAIAESDIPLVIAISCNPATFARDAAALVEGGYTVERVVPVDQFTWSSHVEVAAIFRKS